MSKAIWERRVEDVFIEQFKTSKLLAGRKFFHHDEAGEAETDCVILKAVRGARQLEGPKADEGEVTCEWRSSTATPEDSEDVVQAMMTALSATAASSSLSLFSYFRIGDENASGDRSDAKSLRKRMKTFPVFAKLK